MSKFVNFPIWEISDPKNSKNFQFTKQFPRRNNSKICQFLEFRWSFKLKKLKHVKIC